MAVTWEAGGEVEQCSIHTFTVGSLVPVPAI